MEQSLFHFMNDLPCLPVELPAKTSRLPGNVQAAQREAGRVRALCGTSSDWCANFLRELSFGKTCRGVFPRTEDVTSPDLYPKLGNSGIAWGGEYWTANTPEWTLGLWPSRKEDGVCGLSDFILPPHQVLPMYYLSPRDCLGILRRAEKRGRQLLEIFVRALLAQASRKTPIQPMELTTCLPRSNIAEEHTGGGSECLIVEPDHCTLHDTARCLQGDHDSQISDGTNIVLPVNGHTVGRIGGGSNGLGVGDERDPSFTLTTADRHCVAGFIPNNSAAASTIGYEEEVCATQRGQQQMGVFDNGYVRRLTPLECERLMGYPENYTRIPYRGKSAEECPDTPRYEACGNGWAINSARWVLLGIHQFLTNEKGIHQ